MKVIFKLDGVDITDPNNWAELEIELNYDRNVDKEVVSVNTWELGLGDRTVSNDGKIIAQNHIDGGTVSGGVGVFEGQPFRIKLDNEKGTRYDLFDGFLDHSKSHVKCNQIDAPAVELGGIDWFNDRIDSVTYESMFDAKVFGIGSMHSIRYVIDKQANSAEVLISVVTLFMLIQELTTQVLNVSQWTANVASLINAIAGIISLILQIIYIVALFVALVKLVIELYNLLIQPVKYHYGMYARDLVKIAVNHFDLAFSSTILENPPYNQLFIIPEKYNVKENTKKGFEAVLGYFKPNQNEQVGYYKGTPGELIRSLQEMFNAKIVIRDGTFYFEKQDFQINSPIYQLPPTEDSGHLFNHSEMVSNRILSFSVDQADRNTVREYEGTSVQVQLVPRVIKNKKMVTIGNLERTTLPFTRGKIKTSLSRAEEMLLKIFNSTDAVVRLVVRAVNIAIFAINVVLLVVQAILDILAFIGIVINLPINTSQIPPLKAPTFANLISGRIGLLKMESDFIAIPKMVMLRFVLGADNRMLSTSNRDINALKLWNDYHYFKSFIALPPTSTRSAHRGNQYLIKEIEQPIPFCFEDYEKVRKNNAIFDSDGNRGFLLSLKFNPANQTATGTYKIEKAYTFNLRQVITQPDGK